MKKNELRRRGIVRFISLYWERFGLPPSVREIASAAGVQISCAWRYLHVLAKAGYLALMNHIPRSVRVTPAGKEYAAV